MSEIREALRAEASNVDPSPNGLEETFARVERRRLRRRVGIAVVALGSAGAALLLLFLAPFDTPPSERRIPLAPPTTATSDPSPTPGAAGSTSFVPATFREGGKEIMPVTFPDGSAAEIMYPPQLSLAERGVVPDTLGFLPGVCGHDFVIARSDLRGSVYEGEGPIAAYEGVGGGPVELWPGASGFAPHYLVFRFGGWHAALPCPGSEQDAIRDGARWASLLDGEERPDGFLVLEAAPPLEISKVGDGFTGPSLLIGPGDDAHRTFLSIAPARDCRGSEPYRQEGSARWCIEGTGGALVVTMASGDDSLIDRFMEDLAVRGIRLAAT